jgi:hypothetical protein
MIGSPGTGKMLIARRMPSIALFLLTAGGLLAAGPATHGAAIFWILGGRRRGARATPRAAKGRHSFAWVRTK